MNLVKKTTVALICGGQNSEHLISLFSAKNVFNALDREKFHREIIYIDKKGNFRYAQDKIDILPTEDLPLLVLAPGQGKNIFIFKDNPEKSLSIDIAFPILHGLLGEDGTLQGLFKLCNMPFVGNDVLSSAINMDKEITKKLLKQAKIDVAEFLIFHHHQKNQINFDNIVKKLGLPFFLKPGNTGSSIGVHKVKSHDNFDAIVEDAFRYDEKIIVEEFIQGREIECAVLGDEEPKASLPGEIIIHHEFYTYEAKYFDEKGADVVVPAALEKTEISRFQQIAVEAFKALCCSGLARVDFFYTSQGRIVLNEINTLPGFTNTSMYPKCWEATGIAYSALIEKLIMLGLKKQRIFSL